MKAKEKLGLSFARDYQALRMELERKDKIIAAQNQTIELLREALRVADEILMSELDRAQEKEPDNAPDNAPLPASKWLWRELWARR